MGKIWDLEKFQGKTAIIDEYGNSLTYDLLKSESYILADRIGRRCLVFCLCRNEIDPVVDAAYIADNGTDLISAQTENQTAPAYPIRQNV